MADHAFVHEPVLLRDVLELLDVRPDGSYADLTCGLGGHSAAIAERLGPTGSLLCVDQDRKALAMASARVSGIGRGRVTCAHANARELAEVAAKHGFGPFDGILLDLGVSSMQLDDPERGFSYRSEAALDMRMDPDRTPLTAADVVNTWDEQALADVFYRYGEIRESRRLARAIVRARPIRTTLEFTKAVEGALGASGGRTHIHPATPKAYQAVRILVNAELDTLDAVLPLAKDSLGFGAGHHGGRLVVISFHSLEDRRVKQYFRRESTGCVCPPRLPVCRCGHEATLRELTRRGIRPGDEETARNPRARSAVLRAAERIA
ncbi:MAG: 16S rRNA (cytosine(1402)-N(4))-methyltransferase RsmH [Dehalococcoidia bacterium]